MLQPNRSQKRRVLQILFTSVFILVLVVVGVFAVRLPKATFSDNAKAYQEAYQVNADRDTNSKGGSNGLTGDYVSETSTQAELFDDSASGGGAYEPGVVLVDMAEGFTVDEAIASIAWDTGIEGVTVINSTSSYVELALPEGVMVSDALDVLACSRAIDSVQPNFVYHLLDEAGPSLTAVSPDYLNAYLANGMADSLTVQATTTDDPLLEDQWALESMRALEAWDTVRAEGAVTVAVFDNYFNLAHEDLVDNIVAPYNAVIKRENEEMSVPENYTGGNESHGTHVAGIVSAAANNGAGTAGVSYNANVMPVRIQDDEGKIYSTWVINAYDRLLSIDSSGAETTVSRSAVAEQYNVRVVNMSIGGVASTSSDQWAEMTDDALLKKVDEARAAGIVTVAAAGNSTISTPPFSCYPGDYVNIVSVINIDQSENTASSSNYNAIGERYKNISAPGTAIKSTMAGGIAEYGLLSGTSMAAPHVSGVLALMFAADPELTVDEAVSKLYSTAKDLNADENVDGTKFDYKTGWGEVDAFAAIEEHAIGLTGVTETVVGKSAELFIFPAQEDGIWVWSSSDTAIATVSGDINGGVAVGKSPGAATISASNGSGRYAIADIQVHDPAIRDAGTGKVLVDGECFLGLDQGAELSVDAANPSSSWVWSTTDSSIVSIAAEGKKATVVGKAYGTATISVALETNSDIKDEVTVTVKKKSLEDATLAGVDDQPYSDGGVTLPNLSVELDGRTLRAGVDYDVSYENNYHATADGEYAVVTAVGKGDYEGSVVGRFSIKAIDISSDAVSVSGIEDAVYTGSAIYQDFSVSFNGRDLVEGVDFSVSYSNNVNAGTASVVIQGLGDFATYSGGNPSLPANRIETFDIEPAVISRAKLSQRSFGYDGTVKSPSVIAKDSDGKIIDSGNYVVTIPSGRINAGTYTYTVSPANSNYTGSASATLTIAPSYISSVRLSSTRYVYDGTVKTPSVTVAGANGKTLIQGVDYILTTPLGRTNVGSYTFTATSTGKNYVNGSKSATFTISKAAVASISLAPSSCTFDGTQKNPLVVVKGSNGKTLISGKDYTLARPLGRTKVGTYTYTASGEGNYVGSVNAVLSIGKSTNANPIKRIYGQQALDTMKAIVEAGKWKSGGTVVLATDGGYWDGLTANGVAGLVDAPIVLTNGSSLSTQARSVIAALKPAKIVICGGPYAISYGVESAAKQAAGGNAKVKRLYGQAADDTAYEIFLEGKSATGATDNWSTTAFVCTDGGYWDALSAAPISYVKHMPIFLTQNSGGSLSVETLSAMKKGGVKNVIIVGGPYAVNGRVETQLRNAGFTFAGRLYGQTATDTSAKVAQYGIDQGLSANDMGIATTGGYWDALAGAALCGKRGSVVVLVDGPSARTISEVIATNSADIANVSIFGGPFAVSNNTESAIKRALR